MEKKTLGIVFIKGLPENIADKPFTDKKELSLIVLDGGW